MSYLDTSVLAAYYCPEPRSAAVQKVLRRITFPAISPLVEVEFHSAVALKVRTGQFDITTANRIVSMFQLHVADGCYRRISIQAREYALARDWIARFSVPLRTLDALHLAVAFANDLPLVTADSGLAQSAKLLGIKCRLMA